MLILILLLLFKSWSSLGFFYDPKKKKKREEISCKLAKVHIYAMYLLHYHSRVCEWHICIILLSDCGKLHPVPFSVSLFLLD